VPHLRVDAPPAASGAAVEVLDYHTAGEPFRIIVRGYPELAGTNILERRRSALQQHDHLRKMLMWEPRGHADMYGGILVPPDHDEAQVGVLFMHNEGYSTMCGHGTIALATALVERAAQSRRQEPQHRLASMHRAAWFVPLHMCTRTSSPPRTHLDAHHVYTRSPSRMFRRLQRRSTLRLRFLATVNSPLMLATAAPSMR
jgi:hypothetical protein